MRANLKCEFNEENPNLPCKRCVAKRYVCGVKTLGPKSQVVMESKREEVTITPERRRLPKPVTMLFPLKPITRYDPTINQEELYGLLYIHDYPVIIRGRIIATLLANRIFAHYDRSIVHRGLRYALLAHAYWLDHSTMSTGGAQSTRYINQACQTLRRKLDDPGTVDEGDLFCAFLVAMWYENESFKGHNPYAAAAFATNAEGVLAIMQHLFTTRNDEFLTSPFAVFWPFMRDEILRSTYESIQNKMRFVENQYYSLQSDRRDTLFRQFSQLLGPSTLEQRWLYQQALLANNDSRTVRTSNQCDILYLPSEVMGLLTCHEIMYVEKSRTLDSGWTAWDDSILAESQYYSSPIIQQKAEMSIEERRACVSIIPYSRYLLCWALETKISLQLLHLSTATLQSHSVCQSLSSSESVALALSILSLCHELELEISKLEHVSYTCSNSRR